MTFVSLWPGQQVSMFYELAKTQKKQKYKLFQQMSKNIWLGSSDKAFYEPE